MLCCSPLDELALVQRVRAVRDQPDVGGDVSRLLLTERSDTPVPIS